ncbi:hypothetical protein T11_16655 [Trichinella zimbabwensis]|uniref:Uncharacterized protein n=1 Tax=Trichinella zimbabwensis TaxID=268475 RepID=A0A0V1HV15_9BILA|nr:hypothetical protein T11_16655 [Trichinella zimbabwensis]
MENVDIKNEYQHLAFTIKTWINETKKPIEKKAAKAHKRNENDKRNKCAPPIQALANGRFEKKTRKRHTVT